MSKQVDERIVKMQFDNAEFESRAKNTISTLDSLSSALQLPNGSKGLDQIQQGVKQLNFSALNSALETVNYRFSVLGAVATEAFNRAVNAAVNAGQRIVSALTITPIKEGFSEYELQIESVKRILNSAKNENGLPVTLDQVNRKLDELNTYADKTIYSFSDMTTNIGKFTNAGVDLDKSVLAIQGIANEAALAGANSQEASRAMYNFAQALSAGYVKLIDWKSIENANMATVGFKEELIKTAVELGTLTQQGDKYISTTKDMTGKVSTAFDATSNFNESLAHQWMTSEVLTTTLAKYADETTEIGKAAFKAATEVTTFHKLLDTLKESLGSGWNQTWQLVIGDFEESKKLWTGINDVLSGAINASADARNGMLKDWHDLGGRAILIYGLTKTWEGLVNVATEFKGALDSLVPDITGKDLYDLSVRIRDLGSNFRNFTNRESETFRHAFDGLAAVVDIFLQIISAVARTVAPAVGPLSDLAYLLFSSTGSLGEWLSGIAESAKESDFFYEKIQQLLDPIRKFIEYIQKGIDKLDELTNFKEKLGNFKDSILETLFGKDESDGKIERRWKEVEPGKYALHLAKQNSKLAGAFSVLDRVKETIKNFVSTIGDAEPLKHLGDIFIKLGSAIGKFAQGLGGAVLDTIVAFGKKFKEVFSEGFNKETFETLLGGGLLAFIALKIKKLTEVFEDPFKAITDIFGGKSSLSRTISEFGESLGGFFESLGGALDGFKSKFNAESMMNIAKAIAILVGSLVVLSFVDTDKLGTSVLALGAVMSELVGVMKLMDTVLGPGGSKKIAAYGASAVALSVAILILSGAVRLLGGLDEQSLFNGVLAVGVLMTLMTLMSRLGGNKLSTKGFVTLAISIKIIQSAVVNLGKLDEQSLLNGVLAVGVLMTLMTLMSRLGGKNFSAKGFITLSVSLLIIQRVVKELGELDEQALLNGVLAVGVLMLLMTLMSKVGGKNFSAKGLLLMSVSIYILKDVIKELGTLDDKALGKGMLAVSALMIIMGAISKLGGKNLGGGFAMVAMAKSMTILSGVVKEFAAMPLASLAQGIIALGVCLTEFAVALNFMKGTIGGSAALLIAVAAINLLMPVIKTLASLSVPDIAKALIALGLAFAVFGGAAMLLQGAIPAMLGLSAAVAVLGVGILALGAGLLVAGAGMTAFAVGFPASAAAVVAGIGILMVGMLAKIPLIVTVAVMGIAAIIKALGDAAPVIIQGLVKIGLALLDGLTQLYPAVATAILEFLVTMLTIFAQYMPMVTNALVELVIQLIDGIAAAIYNNSDRIITAVHYIVIALLDLVLATLQEILRHIPGVGGQIEEELGKVRDAMREDFDQNYASKLGSDFTQGLADGTRSKTEDLQAAGSEAGNSIKDGVLGGFSELPDSVSGMFGGQIPESIRNAMPGAEGAATELGDGTKSSLLESWGTLGDTGLYLNQGIADGILGNESIATEASSLLGDDVLASLNGSMEINSPSQATWNSGMYLDQGLANGITENQGFVSTAITALGSMITGAFSALTNTFSAAGKANGSAFGRGVASGSGVARTAGFTLGSSAAAGAGSVQGVFGQNGSASAGTYATTIRGRSGEARGAGSYIGAYAASGLGTARPAFSRAGMSSGTAYSTGVSSKRQSARDAGSGVANSALSGAKSITGFFNAGVDSMAGYIRGLWSKVHEVADTAASIVSNALSSAKHAIDSNSPSRKYMQLGVDSDEGYILGVESKAKQVNNAMSTLALGAMAAFYEGISRADMVANSDFVVTPSVVPVIDMNGVYNSVDYLDQMFNGAGGVLGSITTDINTNMADIARITETTNRILTTLQNARPITIDGKTVIGWIDGELGALV